MASPFMSISQALPLTPGGVDVPTSFTLMSPVTVSPGPPDLAELPIELLHEIAGHLPASSVAVWSLASKYLLYMLGTKAYVDVRNIPTQREVFLHLLARDLPDYFADRSTTGGRNKLLKRMPSCSPSTFEKNARLHYPSDDAFLAPYKRFGFAVTWPHVIFALKDHASATTHATALDAFRHEASSRSTSLWEHFAWGMGSYLLAKPEMHFSAAARIVSSHVILRCIYTVSSKHKNIEISGLKGLDLDVCHHLNTADSSCPWNQNRLATVVRRKKRKYDLSAYSCGPGPRPYITYETDDDSLDAILATGSIFHQCHFCFTEYEVFARPAGLNSRGQVLVVAWHDLGNGRWLDGPFWDRSNVQWRALAGHRRVRQYGRIGYFPPGSVRDAFEKGDGTDLR